MAIGLSPGGVRSILPSIRHTIWRSAAERPQRSVPRIPAVTVLMAILTSRLPRNGANTSVVNRNAPSATFSAASKTLPRRMRMLSSTSEPFSPSLIALPSAVRRSRRELSPVLTLSPSLSSMPGTSGYLAPLRSTQAGICTASTIAGGAGRAGFDLDCAIEAPGAPSASATNAAPIENCFTMTASTSVPDRSSRDCEAGLNAGHRGPCAVIIHVFRESLHAAPVSPRSRRARGAGALGPQRRFSRLGGTARPGPSPEILLPFDVSVPLGQAAHGARAQLYHRGRDDPLPPDARLQRSAADGMGRVRPPRRERRDGKRRAARKMDLREHRLHEEAAPVARLRDRLGARARHLLARLLSLEPVAVSAHARARPRLQEDRHRQLGPDGPDRARERAGDRRPRLAHRRARRKARDPDVLHAHHRLRRGAARIARPAPGMARAREDEAGHLDRQEPRRQHRLPV